MSDNKKVFVFGSFTEHEQRSILERKPIKAPQNHKAKSVGSIQFGSLNLVTENYSVNTNGELKKGQVFEIDDVKAWKSVLVSVTCYTLGLFMIAKAPWYLLPLAWAWTGNAITGFFVIGHDCAHKSFSKNKFVEDIVGTLAFLPLVYPYEPWPFKHDRHYAKTNMLVHDTAWRPVPPEEFDSSPTLRKAIVFAFLDMAQLGLGCP